MRDQQQLQGIHDAKCHGRSHERRRNHHLLHEVLVWTGQSGIARRFPESRPVGDEDGTTFAGAVLLVSLLSSKDGCFRTKWRTSWHRRAEVVMLRRQPARVK